MNERPEECECCHFKTEVKEYSADRNFPKNLGVKKWLCELCAGTMTGVFHEYPEQIGAGALHIMKTVCYVGNAILAARGKNEPGKEVKLPGTQLPLLPEDC